MRHGLLAKDPNHLIIRLHSPPIHSLRPYLQLPLEPQLSLPTTGGCRKQASDTHSPTVQRPCCHTPVPVSTFVTVGESILLQGAWRHPTAKLVSSRSSAFNGLSRADCAPFSDDTRNVIRISRRHTRGHPETLLGYFLTESLRPVMSTASIHAASRLRVDCQFKKWV